MSSEEGIHPFHFTRFRKNFKIRNILVTIRDPRVTSNIVGKHCNYIENFTTGVMLSCVFNLYYIVCIGVSTPLQNTTPFFFAKPSLKSANCPSPPVLGNPPLFLSVTTFYQTNFFDWKSRTLIKKKNKSYLTKMGLNFVFFRLCVLSH